MFKLIQQCNKCDILLFLIVYLLFLMDNILLTVVVPIIPDYFFGQNLNYTATEQSLYGVKSFSPVPERYNNGNLGTLFAAKAFVQLILTPILGYLTSFVHYHITLLIGSCCMFISAIMFGFGTSYVTLVMARALHGVASSAISVNGMSTLATIVPREYRCEVMPICFGGIAFGVLIGYPFGGAMYQLFGKTVPFILIAICILFIMVLQVLCMNLYPDSNTLPNRISFDSLAILKDSRTIILGLTICISTSSLAILEAYIPEWLLVHVKPKPSKWQLGSVFIPDSIGYLIGSHFAGLLSVDQWRTAFASMVVVGVCCCLLPLTTSLSQLRLPHFFLGLGVGSVDACLVPLLANFVDVYGRSHYGPIYAFQQLFVALAYSFGPFLGGQAVNLFGFPWLIRIVGIMNLVFCLLLVDFEKDENNLISSRHPIT